MKIAISIIVALALVAGGAWWWSEQRRAQEWAEVDRAVERLKAGVEHEARITLRMRIADAAAAVESYAKAGSGRNNEPRVELARRAVRFLDLALQDSSGLSRVKWPAEKWVLFKVHELHRTDIRVGCDGETPFVWNADLPAAYVAVALRALEEVEGRPALLPFQPVDLKGETENCRAQLAKKKEERAAQDAAARAKVEAHRRAFPIHVELKAEYYSPGTLVWIDGRRWEYDFYQGQEEHIDARESVEVHARRGDAFEVSVNGARWFEPWQRRPGAPVLHQTRITVADAKMLAGETPFPLQLEVTAEKAQTVSFYLDGAERAQMVEVAGAAHRVKARREIRVVAYQPDELRIAVNGSAWNPQWVRVGGSSFYQARVAVGELALVGQ